jgi:hypothetical protein
MRFSSSSSDKSDVMDYSAAVANAVAWLGNRYLLARPTGRLTPDKRLRDDLPRAPGGLHGSRCSNN